MLESLEILCGAGSEASGSHPLNQSMTDARLLKSKPFRDLRGSFEVFWEAPELAAIGINFNPVSNAFSYNEKAGTLRGMHYQKSPHGQAKLVSCITGCALDVIADLRPESPSYLRWAATELRANSGQAIYIPVGYAHGFVTLSDHTTLAYLIEGDYLPHASGTVRWDDPILGINWPIADLILTERDQTAPNFVP
jgi:dTDP-4-dehydrorhamnose 3,5-epimerase